MNSKDTAYSIGAFIEKYYSSNKVEIVNFGFTIKNVMDVSILDNSITEYGKTITFKGVAKILYGDGKTSINTEKQCSITGNAIIRNKELKEIESITITQISIIK